MHGDLHVVQDWRGHTSSVGAGKVLYVKGRGGNPALCVRATLYMSPVSAAGAAEHHLVCEEVARTPAVVFLCFSKGIAQVGDLGKA